MEGEVHLELVYLAGNNDLIFSQEAKSHLTAGEREVSGSTGVQHPLPQALLSEDVADRSMSLLPSGFLLFLTMAQEGGFSPPDSITIHQFSNVPASTQSAPKMGTASGSDTWGQAWV